MWRQVIAKGCGKPGSGMRSRSGKAENRFVSAGWSSIPPPRYGEPRPDFAKVGQLVVNGQRSPEVVR